MNASKRIFFNAAATASRSCQAPSAIRAQPSASIFRPLFAPTCRAQRSAPTFLSSLSRRYNSTNTRPPNPLTDSKPATPEEEAQNQERRAEEPAYLIYFTCKPCTHRSAHRISKQGYHKGTVLITCPSCKNKHVISDHLKIFMDAPVTLEDILKEKGQKLTKGTMEGDMEWWANEGSEGEAEGKTIASPKGDSEAGTGGSAEGQKKA